MAELGVLVDGVVVMSETIAAELQVQVLHAQVLW